MKLIYIVAILCIAQLNVSAAAEKPIIEELPASKPDGDKFNVVISNQSGRPAKVFWMNREGEPQPHGMLETAWSKPYETRPGEVWMIADADGKPRGYFNIGDRTAHAVIPATKP